jgi:AcrR family transcriptional regulator
MFYEIEDESLTRTILKTRRKILENSFRLFSTDGIFKTTMVEISNETGITRRTLYNHYSTKEEIALILHNLLWDDLLSRTGQEQGEKTLGFLKDSLHNLYRELKDGNGKLQFIVRFDQFAQENHENFKEEDHIVNYLMNNSPLLEYLREFKRRGYFRDDSISPELLAKVCFESFIAYIERISFRESTYIEEGSYFDSDFELFISTLLSIISVEKDSES